MKALRNRATSFALVLLATSLGIGAATSCALSEMGAEGRPDGSPLPATDAAGATADAAPLDASTPGCDASAPDCVTKPLGCDEADFCPVPSPLSAFHALVDVWGSGPSDVWAVGSGGTVLHFDGSAWTATPAPTKETLGAVWGTGPADVWTASTTSSIFRTSGFAGGAASWRKVASASPDELPGYPVLAMWSPPSGEVHLGTVPFFVDDGVNAGLSSQTVRADLPDGGLAWRSRSGVDRPVHAIWGSSAADVWAVGGGGLALHGVRATPKGPHAWTAVDSVTLATLRGVWGTGPNELWAVGDSGTIRRMSAGAPTFESVVSPTGASLRHVWGSDAKDVWAIGDAGTILHFDGTGWKLATAAFPVGRKPRLYGIWGSGPGDVWIVGDGIVLRGRGAKKSGGAP